MRRIGETFDMATAFCGAAVAGVTLTLPLSFAWSGESTPLNLAVLLDSVPRGAAIGVIVAVTIAVVVTTFVRPWAAWTAASIGAFGLLINHLVGHQVSAPDQLTTQNYVDAICGGLLLGALGAAALRTPLTAFAFALGAAGSFVFGDLSDLLGISERDPYAVLETPPGWLIGVTFALVVLSAVRNSAPARQERGQEETALSSELPVAPVLAVLIFALVTLMGTEYLSRQFDRDGGHTIDLALVIAATVIAATVAAMLLPRRDGAAILLAACLVPVADSLGSAPRPAWTLVAVLVAVVIGILAGLRLPAPQFGFFLVAVLAVFAIATAALDNAVIDAISGTALAFVAGFCCGAAAPRYTPSGVFALAALFLPSVVTALPVEGESPARDAMAGTYTPAVTGLVITLGCVAGLTVLHRYRPPVRTDTAAPAPTGVVADI